MANENYRETLHQAREEFAELLTQRRTLNERLAKLARTITALRTLCGEHGSTGSPVWKFTNACRYILGSSRTPKTPAEIREDLDALGFPTKEYGNVMASIHTILKRLVANGEMQTIKADGKTMYAATSKLESASEIELYW